MIPDLVPVTRISQRVDGMMAGSKPPGTDLAASILDVLPSAVILADCDRSVRYANGSAEALLANERLLKVADGRIAAATDESQVQLSSAIAAVCDPNREALKLVRLETVQDDIFFATVAAHQSEGDRQALIVLRLKRCDAMAGQLKDLFDLTNAEADTALRLADGFSLREISAARGIRLGTARAQLRSIFAKMGCSRQARVVSIINSMVLPVEGAGSSAD